MSHSAVRNLKKFDEFDIRALKALGKWENDDGGAHKILNNTKRRRRRVYKQDSDSEQEAEEDMSEDNNEYFNLTADNFNCLATVKTEIEIEDPLVEEIQPRASTLDQSALSIIPQIQPVKQRKRQRQIEIEPNEYDEFDQSSAETYEKVLSENTKAMKQHTAAIAGLTDAITSLTSIIRSYMYNK